jgi:hypothetical protein
MRMEVSMAKVTIGAGAARARSRRGLAGRQARVSRQWDRWGAAHRGGHGRAQ